jgi:hypothetical protein
MAAGAVMRSSRRDVDAVKATTWNDEILAVPNLSNCPPTLAHPPLYEAKGIAIYGLVRRGNLGAILRL